MLFNSYAFIFFFFPVVLVAFFLIGRRHARAAACFLTLASLFFYGWWSVEALPLLIGSTLFNYWAGLQLTRAPGRSDRYRKRMLIFAIAVDLGVLSVFKYADFFIGNLNDGLGAAGAAPLPLLHIVLPIGISFYTFTQIAFLVDCWQDKVRERSFLHYALFVTYFPHLIAGPVLHHAQMMPQFADPKTYRVDASKISLGFAIFVFGLAKKLLIADRLGDYVDFMFTGVQGGTLPTLYTSWLGVLGYTLQIYFDFSGYSDMAIGLSLCLGVNLPLNFNSPYKAANIIDFWRRWHMSLSIFLRDYLYVPLGGNRRGPVRRYVNLFITMLLGGLWHGAAWTFVIWGGLHGTYLAINHLWLAKFGATAERGRLARIGAWALTFLCVMLAWVVFRAENMHVAGAIYKGMLGLNGAPQSAFTEFGHLPARKAEFFQTLLIGLFICLALPPTITLQRWVPTADILAARPRMTHAFTAMMALFTVTLLGLCVSRLGIYSPFLYFQF